MGNTNNKFIATLAISNILGFIVIFALLWMLWNNNNATVPDKNVIVTYSPSELQAIQPAAGPRRKPESRPATPSVNARDLSIITAVAKEVKSNIESEGRLEQKTVTENNDVNKDRTTGALSDDEYIATYDQLKSKQQQVKKDYSEMEVSTAQATGKSGSNAGTTADHFNKVDVSNLKNNQTEKLTLAQQVAAVASRDFSDDDSKSEKSSARKEYLGSLKDAEAERQNEMRTLTVKRGETLWKISTRAYGTGFLYKKIFEANPHLTSPDSITVGETLRVPL